VKKEKEVKKKKKKKKSPIRFLINIIYNRCNRRKASLASVIFCDAFFLHFSGLRISHAKHNTREKSHPTKTPHDEEEQQGQQQKDDGEKEEARETRDDGPNDT